MKKPMGEIAGGRGAGGAGEANERLDLLLFYGLPMDRALANARGVKAEDDLLVAP